MHGARGMTAVTNKGIAVVFRAFVTKVRRDLFAMFRRRPKMSYLTVIWRIQRETE
jgi:hypothetical protein